MLVGSCGDTVRGDPGQRVGVRVADLSVVDVGDVPATGSRTYDATPALRKMMGPATPVCKLTAEPLVPTAGPVDKIIAPAVAPLQGALGQVPVLGQQAGPAPAAPPPAAPAAQAQPGAAPTPPALTSPATGPFFGPAMPSNFPFMLGTFNSGLPHFNYAELLTIGRPGAGGIGKLSAGMLTADLFGSPSVSNGNSGLGKQSAAANDVAAAGRASALPATGVERVALPILVAVLMLASVAAALLRSWVLGRR
ncbi:MAG: hypothetical protein M3319_03340 [Actinomycetota bacterium]|nr:hypothetical protein [Actinomycetota bacterium]MDQ3899510.1 hypothetical protein [Actinomycetota bacterium]